METVIDKLKENLQSSIIDTKNLIEDLDKKLSKSSVQDPERLSCFFIKMKVDYRLQVLQELHNILSN